VQDERRHIFDVIKINMFGFKQARVVVVERGSSAPTTKISICTAAGEARGGHLPPSRLPRAWLRAGKPRRVLAGNEVTGLEEVPSAGRAAEDVDRSVLFKYSEGGREAKRELLFVTKRQRDAFLDEVRPRQAAGMSLGACVRCCLQPHTPSPATSCPAARQMERIDPKLVPRRKDGTLQSSGDRAKRMAVRPIEGAGGGGEQGGSVALSSR
jgi:hypothetical protein